MNKKLDSFSVFVELEKETYIPVFCMCERKSSIKQKTKPKKNKTYNFVHCVPNTIQPKLIKVFCFVFFLVCSFFTFSHLTCNKGITNNTKEKEREREMENSNVCFSLLQ